MIRGQNISDRLGHISGSKSVAVAGVIRRLSVANKPMKVQLFKWQDHRNPSPAREGRAETTKEEESGGGKNITYRKNTRNGEGEWCPGRDIQGDGETNTDGLLTQFR